MPRTASNQFSPKFPKWLCSKAPNVHSRFFHPSSFIRHVSLTKPISKITRRFWYFLHKYNVFTDHNSVARASFMWILRTVST